MAEDDSQEKTEEPSQRRIEKALEDGQILSSKEMFVFTSLITGLIFVLGLGAVMPSLLDIWRGYSCSRPQKTCRIRYFGT